MNYSKTGVHPVRRFSQIWLQKFKNLCYFDYPPRTCWRNMAIIIIIIIII